jgi:cytochrome P450
VRAFDQLVVRAIAQRRAQEMIGNDLMTMLMVARDPETGAELSDLELRDEVVTIMGAGHETTASALSWLWHLLSIHPEVEAKLHSELDSVLFGRVPSLDDLARLPYTAAVIKEAMRLYPPVWVLAREAEVEDVIGGFRIPRGSMVLVSPYVTHRHPDHWRDAERFVPERFIGDPPEPAHRFAYLPFGAGPRVCIGNAFAMMEATLIVAMVGQRFRLEAAETAPVTSPTVTLRPGGPLVMRAIDRFDKVVSGRSKLDQVARVL